MDEEAINNELMLEQETKEFLEQLKQSRSMLNDDVTLIHDSNLPTSEKTLWKHMYRLYEFVDWYDTLCHMGLEPDIALTLRDTQIHGYMDGIRVLTDSIRSVDTMYEEKDVLHLCRFFDVLRHRYGGAYDNERAKILSIFEDSATNKSILNHPAFLSRIADYFEDMHMKCLDGDSIKKIYSFLQDIDTAYTYRVKVLNQLIGSGQKLVVNEAVVQVLIDFVRTAYRASRDKEAQNMIRFLRDHFEFFVFYDLGARESCIAQINEMIANMKRKEVLRATDNSTISQEKPSLLASVISQCKLAINYYTQAILTGGVEEYEHSKLKNRLIEMKAALTKLTREINAHQSEESELHILLLEARKKHGLGDLPETSE